MMRCCTTNDGVRDLRLRSTFWSVVLQYSRRGYNQGECFQLLFASNCLSWLLSDCCDGSRTRSIAHFVHCLFRFRYKVTMRSDVQDPKMIGVM